jgi:hypothetical protein
VTLLRIPFLDYEAYTITVVLQGLQNDSSAIQAHVFSLIAFNDAFTLYEMFYRFGFLILSMITVSVFTWRLRQHSFASWSLEQKWLLTLMFLLIGFNSKFYQWRYQRFAHSYWMASWISASPLPRLLTVLLHLTFADPFYTMTLLLDGKGPIVLDSILQSSFVSGLLLYWLCVFHGIRVVSYYSRVFCCFGFFFTSSYAFFFFFALTRKCSHCFLMIFKSHRDHS